MKILKIIHGYPPKYNAGSEVYSQLLCNGLSKNHEVIVFTREEDPFKPLFSLTTDYDYLNPAIKLFVINIPRENYRYAYRNKAVDEKLQIVIKEEKPNIVHIGHLNHLSVSLLQVCKQSNLPIIFTLHDYWLMCPRGQFIRRNPKDANDCWQLCHKQVDRECAEFCYAGYFSGAEEDKEKDLTYWTDWIAKRMQYIKKVSHYVNKYIAPARYLQNRFVTDFVIPKEKLIYLDYGFDMSRFSPVAERVNRKTFTFGYIGTHIPAKGIQLLIEAFGKIITKAKLIIWGREHGYNTQALKNLCQTLPVEKQTHIEWRHEYANEHIMSDVFQYIDCLVVPSIWVENSPLVIHEALQARIPIITANAGGMAEYVKEGVNGLLFAHRDVDSLTEKMQSIVDSPALAAQLKQTGYLASEDGNIPALDEHIAAIEQIYLDVIKEKQANEYKIRTVAHHI